MQKQLILWTGPKHSGKTTRAGELVKATRKEGLSVAGLLAPSLYYNGKLIGFDILDLQTNARTPLAKRKEGSGKRPFTFIDDGLRLGNIALSIKNTQSADLVIVDEFGPLELEGRLWRRDVDTLLTRQNNMILLVVRQDLAREVCLLYEEVLHKELPASEPESINEVIKILKCMTHNFNT